MPLEGGEFPRTETDEKSTINSFSINNGNEISDPNLENQEAKNQATEVIKSSEEQLAECKKEIDEKIAGVYNNAGKFLDFIKEHLNDQVLAKRKEEKSKLQQNENYKWTNNQDFVVDVQAGCNALKSFVDNGDDISDDEQTNKFADGVVQLCLEAQQKGMDAIAYAELLSRKNAYEDTKQNKDNSQPEFLGFVA